MPDDRRHLLPLALAGLVAGASACSAHDFPALCLLLEGTQPAWAGGSAGCETDPTSGSGGDADTDTDTDADTDADTDTVPNPLEDTGADKAVACGGCSSTGSGGSAVAALLLLPTFLRRRSTAPD